MNLDMQIRIIFETQRAINAICEKAASDVQWITVGGRHIPIQGKMELKNSLGIERKDMPQLAVGPPNNRRDVTKEFFQKLRADGISVMTGRVAASELKPTQKDVGRANIARMIARTKAGQRPEQGIVISKDHYILDGHHEWVAYQRMYGANHRMLATKVGMDIRPLMKAAEAFTSVKGMEHQR